jgi:endonuclease YncB( thermonuclease family)
MFRRLLPFAIFSLLTFNAAAETIVGTVVGISDGDTLTLLTNDKRQAKVRLGEIDTPESGQPYGAQAKKELSDLAFGRQAAVDVQDTDRYGRTVGRVRVDNLDINSELVRRGAAWVYRQYLRDRSLLEIEAGARARRAGLWALPEAQQTPPWEWRTAKRVGDPQLMQPQAPQSLPRLKLSTSTCGAKRTCGQMASCEEARYYLNQCGVRRLDGDGDGVPCEKMCR